MIGVGVNPVDSVFPVFQKNTYEENLDVVNARYMPSITITYELCYIVFEYLLEVCQEAQH